MAIENLEGVLAAQPFARGLDPRHLGTLAGCVTNVTFVAGRFVFRRGDPADLFYLLREGAVTVELHAPGRGPVTVETVDAGEALGWSWLFAPYRWHFDARATTFVRALALDGACLRRKSEEDPALGFALMQRLASVMVKRLEATQRQLLGLYGVPA